jgi:hypothetical protein
MNTNKKLTAKFKSNKLLDSLLSELKELLNPVQVVVEKKFDKPNYPVGLIVGNPRSGGTLFLQWLASLNVFSYPTNLLTRFAYSPYIGALIQKMLFDSKYDFHGDFSDIQSGINYNSNLGKSKGALATNEFQHFFRNHINHFDSKFIDRKELENISFESIRKGLASIEYAFAKPFITKGLMLQYNIKDVFRNIPELFFFYIKRNPLFVMQSLLLAREKMYDDRNVWCSVKPKEYKYLLEMDLYYQIAGQVFFTDYSIENELENIPIERKILVTYEDFCVNPVKYFNIIKEKYRSLGYLIICEYNGEKSFENLNKIKLPYNELKKFERAYEDFSTGRIKFL